MAKIQGFSVKNFGTLKDITMGKLWNTQGKEELTPLTAVIGKNGVGKSTLFDVFGFLSDCLKFGVEEACDMNGRGGFHKMRSQGSNEPIEFHVYYREDYKSRPITYELSIDLDDYERPYVKSERLRQRRAGQDRGRPFSFLLLNEGRGAVWKGELEGLKITNDDFETPIENLLASFSQVESTTTELVELSDKRRLGIAILGTLTEHPRISSFREFIENWYLSYFTPDAARSLPLSGPQKHLNMHGDNLGNVVQYMEREHKTKFQNILNKIANKIPGIEHIDTERTNDGRLLLRFNNKGFQDPFYAQKMSDGTLKVFAYLLLLEDPSPPQFLCIEEPENGLYHKLLETLASEFRQHATGKKGGSQIFVTTHQPYFVDALQPNEVWILDKNDNGFSNIRRASDDGLLVNLVAEGIPLGSLWYSDYLDLKVT
ncbi:MAG TPA: ATPase [Sulfurimonas sp. UBA12504]|nr:MAG: ATPase [Sulfurimonas sp. GWF2_37_8]DAB30281.1 MAG TPA: ATPase [Sulfurimonas sp. UBA12504]